MRIDSTGVTTDLCKLGAKYGTDKSPYNTDSNLHKHPYTAVYQMLFAPFRHKKINFAEIGILENKSMQMWREYFTKATLYGFEWFDDKINKAVNDGLPNTHYHKMNVQDEASIHKAFNEAGKKYDILIEDSTHKIEDQIRVVNIAHKYMNKGGILIIEDIFRNQDESAYSFEQYESMLFVTTDHYNRYSPGWDNDKLCILIS
jgi:hypothetical protein